jgi:uncharacterized protein YhaN
MESADKILAPLAENDEKITEISQRHEQLKATLDDGEEHVRDLFAEWKAAQKQLDDCGSDGLAAHLREQRQSLIEEIAARARHFAEISAGLMLVERALRKYRENHRSSLLENASQAFAEITGGAFAGLESIYDGKREILVGTRADGSSLSAAKMSKGTRFQLYLALRVAGHAEYGADRSPLPFFADDILETFDDRRSLAALGLLHAMSQRGQIIYLTHHRHICELALEASEGMARIHQLASHAAGASPATKPEEKERIFG